MRSVDVDVLVEQVVAALAAQDGARRTLERAGDHLPPRWRRCTLRRSQAS